MLLFKSILPKRSKCLQTIPDKQHYLHAMLDFLNLSWQMACVGYGYQMRPAYHRVSGSLQIWQSGERCLDTFQVNLFSFSKNESQVQPFTLTLNTCVRFKTLSCSTCGINLNLILTFLQTPHPPIPANSMSAAGWTLTTRWSVGQVIDRGNMRLCVTQELLHTDPEKGKTWDWKLKSLSNIHVYCMYIRRQVHTPNRYIHILYIHTAHIETYSM